jgi:hypothetical protein
MNEDDLDLAGDAEETLAPAEEQLATISSLVLKQLGAEAKVADLEAALKFAKEELRVVSERELPEAITRAGTLSFTTKDGIKVEVKDDLTVSIPKANKTDGSVFTWMRSHELGDLISKTVVVEIDKGQDNMLALLEEFLEKEDFDFKREEDANTASVKAALKKMLEKGDEVPLKLFGGYKCQKAKITLPKG